MLELLIVLAVVLTLIAVTRSYEDTLPEEEKIQEKIVGLNFGDSLLFVGALLTLATFLAILSGGG